MDGEGTTAQRPVTLDITVEDVNQEVSNPLHSPSIRTPPRELILQEHSINIGSDFATPLEDSSATPSGSLMDKLNDQMMESVMISDSPNNSEEDDIAAIDSIMDEEEGKKSTEPAAEEKHSELGKSTTEINVSTDDQGKDNPEEKGEDVQEQTDVYKEVTAYTSPQGAMHPLDVKNEQEAPQEAKQMSAKDEPVPVCTIFSQGTHPQSLMPDGFQPTLIKSPSFSMVGGEGSTETVNPSKMTTPLICQPSPSLSKFFTDNEQANPASDFFDSFMTPSSFISVSNPNAEIPRSSSPVPVIPASEHQLSSTPSSSNTTVGASLGSSTPTHSSISGSTHNESTSKPEPHVVTATSEAPAPALQPQPFNKLQAVFSASDDPFETALSLSEVDRRHDAWLPSEETKKVLISIATQQYNQAFVETNKPTMPGLKFDNLQVRQSNKI